MWGRPLTANDARYVALRMREWDRREIVATSWTDDPIETANACMMAPEMALSVGADGDPRPIAIIGAVPKHPGVWYVYMFATNDFSRIALSLTKFVRRAMIPALMQAGAHRAETRSMVGHDVAHRWLECLGAVAEAPLKQFGRGGEDFILYAWTGDDGGG